MLSSYMRSRKRCVDDTIAYVKTDAIEYVLSNFYRFTGTLNSLASKIMEKSPSLKVSESLFIEHNRLLLIRIRFNICDRVFSEIVDGFQKLSISKKISVYRCLTDF